MGEVSLEEARGRHVLAALSGGADSVALLLLLCEARDKGFLTLSAAHFEHGIRGTQSLRDAAFCADLCRGMGVPFLSESADVPAEAAKTGEGLETCARRLRYDFLYRAASSEGADLIALAHHADDQAETVLMHLFRGAGSDGASGMRRLSGKLYRPLLNVRKADLISILLERNQPWREDATNRHADNPRNRLRIEVLPILRDIYPGCEEAVCRFAETIADENDLLSRMTENFLRERAEHYPGGTILRLNGSWEKALARRALRRLVGAELNRDKLEELLTLTGGCDVTRGLRARRCGDRLYLIRQTEPPKEQPLNLNGATALEGVCVLRSEDAPPIPEKSLRSTQVLDRQSLEGACLRTRRQCDRIRPLGMAGSRSLSDYMTDRKIDPPLRDYVPVLAKGSEIMWVIGFGISRLCMLKGAQGVRIQCKYDGWGGFEP